MSFRTTNLQLDHGDGLILPFCVKGGPYESEAMLALLRVARVKPSTHFEGGGLRDNDDGETRILRKGS